ncbi:bifunctional phosphopantothenoylcysteine decarboxylase/phosphopantothenate--cysteine ligase CoaBC [Marivirga sp. S37H4]|uniref:Coenzyme A biosynthesis bifunctional protein CoaBC n=1 Tax=Marivirga aurantiaca TaxID=2802615 RepID=A0A934WVQ5_9BACT|nr:bifunctional phosphopantothenoylcysteine decarboxylase/phosphopantothenate--cysteine ligase CoaBC [Marivirga aurantiaca]MBK6263924.1 bifunctional phosphopantothenoylcysteine decarboxylase/phosphopantothenate--cysteine ligase CoaBC [Marivirga aurantiaca]
MLRAKKIILGITGSIAAYKSAVLTRLLVKSGAEVQVIMSESAQDFITPLTLSTLSQKPVLSDFVKDNTGTWNNHVALGLWADLMIIAPASANTLAKCANGICDSLLLATYLSAKCPVIFAPAMDLDMYVHPSTLSNLAKLASYGNSILEATSGELASGLEGKGRLQEPEDILKYIEKHFAVKKNFSGKKILITAGPTYEAIDPVRFVGNRSSGKMGYALAQSFIEQGAEVTLISGPSHLVKPGGIKKFIPVESAQEMYEASNKCFPEMDIAVMSAAVADYRPKDIAQEKIKKADSGMTIEMEKTTDIAKSLGEIKSKKQLLVGFALETNNEEENAIRKLQNKNFDLIVLNSLRNPGSGFNHDTNQVKIFDKEGLKFQSELESKTTIAKMILEQIALLK